MSRLDGMLELNGKTYQLVTLDFETYYDKEYTLSGKLNMSEYVRDDRFHAHGVGIKIGNGETQWFTGADIKTRLKTIAWATSALVAHNTAFDGFILSEHYGVVPALYSDTLSMARAAHGHHTKLDLDTLAKLHGLAGKTKRNALADTKGKPELTDAEELALGDYCKDDVNDTYEIFWNLHDHIPDDELRLIDITLLMFCDPVLEIDIPRVTAELEKEIGAKASALLASGATVEDLMSSEKFATLLKKHINPPQKLSPSTGKPVYAFAKSDLVFQALLKHPNPEVVALCEARLRLKSTIGETRAVRLLEAGKNGAKLPVLLNYSGAHTHRWSGANKMNLQNLKRGGELRRSIMAPKDHVVVVADSAQIEARILAWLAGQFDIVEAFRDKQDLYKRMAGILYDVPIDQVTPEQRFIGKVCVLGLGYGMGPNKLQLTLKQGVMGPSVDLDLSTCKRAVQLYRGANYKIARLWKDMEGVIRSMLLGQEGTYGPLSYGKGYLQLPSGLFLQYYGLHGETRETRNDLVVTEATYLTRYGRSKIYGGLLTENIVQALARSVIAEQMLSVADAGYRIVTMTHDEIVVVCHKDEADKCLGTLLKIMGTPPVWAPDLPLAAEGGMDVNYSK